MINTLLSFASAQEPVKKAPEKEENPYIQKFGFKQFNFNFEQLDSKNNLEYWLLKGDHNKPITDEKNKRGGERSLFLSTLNSENDQPSSFIYQSMDVGFPVNKINLNGFIKFSPATPQSQFTLILTVYDKASTESQLKYVSYQVDNTLDWEEIELSLPIVDEAQFISITGYLQGKGELWLDELFFKFDSSVN
ncbi:hypothetical protein GCM10017161_35320 [Thalassotalea marina]|uniref:Uncharacterized protein n=2 Tax=Thalassotalea marina TaxID=1673741 RepID=A0A919BNU4_9GAMM|nr:hypothetical protein GCM10017161_35320 [Thalassotalea marina]